MSTESNKEFCICEKPLHTKMLSVDRRTPMANELCWRCDRTIEPAIFSKILDDWARKVIPYIGCHCKTIGCVSPYPQANLYLTDNDDVACVGCRKSLEICQENMLMQSFSPVYSRESKPTCLCVNQSFTKSISIHGLTVLQRCRNADCMQFLDRPYPPSYSFSALLDAREDKLLSVVTMPCTCKREQTAKETIICERCTMLMTFDKIYASV
jgi:hypothetical protein